MGRTTPPRRRRMRRFLKNLCVALAVLAVLVAGYVAYAAIRSTSTVTLPTPTGGHRVGRVSREWTDHSRSDPLAPHPGTPRRLSAWLWYPATPARGARPASYAPGAWGGLHLGGLPGLGETRFADVRVHSVAGAPVAEGRFPVVVLEPGLGAAAPQYTAFAENLASHGFVVAGVTPTYSANLTVLHGRVVTSTKAGNPTDSDAPGMRHTLDRLLDVWVADARFAAERVAALNSTREFSGHIDTAKTVYMGHSFGGAASLQACGDDPRCAGAADLDGTEYGPVVHSGLDRPMLLLGSQGSCVAAGCRPTTVNERAERRVARELLAGSTGPVWCWEIHGTGHFNFSDYGAYYLAAPLSSLVGLGGVDGDRALRVTNAYLAAFADHVAYGRNRSLLSRRHGPYREAEPQCVGR